MTSLTLNQTAFFVHDEHRTPGGSFAVLKTLLGVMGGEGYGKEGKGERRVGEAEGANQAWLGR
jgi:hypothetical protein